MSVLDTFNLGEQVYVMEQPGEPDAVPPPTAALLTRPGRNLPLASLQRLHTEAPEMVLYDWVEANERTRLEGWESEILEHAQLVWREHYDPADVPDYPATSPRGNDAPGHLSERIDGIPPLAVSNLLVCLAVTFWALPAGTPWLLPVAVGSLITFAAHFTVHLVTHRNIWQTIDRSLNLAGLLVLILALMFVWIWSGTFPGGAHS